MFWPKLILIVLVSTLIGHVAAQEHTGTSTQSAGSLKLYVFECGRVLARDLSLFNPLIKKGTEMEMVTPCYLIQHKQGTLIWDAGLSDELIKTPAGVDVLDGAFHMSVKTTLTSQLNAIHVDPLSVNYLAFSHLHNDHTGNAKLFINATWLMQESEYQVAYGPNADQYGYHPDDYANLPDVRIVKLHGEYDVFGDGSVTIIPTPGHSAGHQSLLVNLSDTGPVLLSGDLYHFQFNRDHYGIPVWNDKKATIRSFALVDELLEKTNAQLWIHHDKPQFDVLKKSPDYYQ
jgi:glyoxylase-like metal-dependent hydrolase (beta-lactamase superfamily II)